jgi:uncharacterized membrane protein
VEREYLLEVDTAVIAVAVCLAGFGISELASRLGRRRRSSFDDASRANLTTMSASMLALIGILLAFTLDMSVTRFDHRRKLVVDEVNAIGTAWLRSGLCSEPARSRLQSQLRSYALSRYALFTTSNYWKAPDNAKGQTLRDDIWKEASQVATSDPRSIQGGLLIQSVNEVIDLHTRRDDAYTHHVPEPVWWLLILIMLVAMASVGFTDAQGSQSNLAGRIVLAVALSATLSLTLDLDRPQRGFIKVSQAPMRALYDSLGPGP